MNDKHTNLTFQRLKRIISSVVIAIVVWLVIINTVNPSITVSMSDIPVRFIGEATLRENGLVLVNRTQLTNFGAKVRGTRKSLLSDMNDIRVEIDLSGIKTQGKITVNPSVSLPKNITLDKQKFSSVQLNIEPKYEKEIPVKINQTEKELLDNVLIESIPEFDKIKIEGSKDELNSIENCIINVDVSTVTESGKTMYSYFLADKDNQQVAENETIFSNNLTIPVDNVIYIKKTLPIEISFDSELLKDYYITFNDKEISELSSVVGIQNESVDASKLTAQWKNGDYSDGEQEISLEIDTPTGVYIKDPNVKFKAKVEKRYESVLDASIEVKNLPAGYHAALPEHQPLKVMAPKSVTDTIKGTVDAKGLSEGIYSLNAEYSDKAILPKDTVKIEIRKEE